MHDVLWQQLHEMDLQDIAQRTLSRHVDGSELLTVTMLNRPYQVSIQVRSIQSHDSCSDSVACGFLEQLCILSYLINAQNISNANKLVKAEQLEAGQFFFRGPHGLPTQTLEQTFGDDPKGLLIAAKPLAGKACEYGDASVEIELFNRAPVTFIVWAQDEEFPARASILFDANIQKHLPLDALGAAVNLAVKALVKVDIG